MANITEMSTNPDFNYRSLNRKDLMSLSTISNNDMKLRKFKAIDTQRDWSTNLYNLDIEGSSPKKYGVLHQKVDFINKVDDIERTNSKILHHKLNKPEFNLTNKDIDGSSPQCVKFKTMRQFNPLEPKYNLPKVEELQPPVPKFIRDNINVDGIEGAQPKKYFRWETRRMFDCRDIQGNSPKKPYIRGTKYNNIDYSDVTHDVFKTRRHVDPLDPVYEVKYKNGEHYVHGQIQGSKPATNNPYVYPDPFNMKTTDIQGTQVGSKNAINKFSGQNFNLQLGDIRGARSGSLKKGITTKRMTDPLDPRYVIPGQIQLEGVNNNPYGNTIFSKSAKVRQNSTMPAVKGSDKKNIAQSNSQNNNNNIKIIDNEGDKISEKNEIKSNTKSENVVRPNTTNENKTKEHKKLIPYELVGFNNQIYLEQPTDFDAEKFNKPDPYYGFVHDKYIISSENPLTKGKKIEELRKTLLQKHTTNAMGSMNNTGGFVINSNNKTANSDSKGLSKGVVFGKSSNTSTTDFYKQSYAQLMDKFIKTGGMA